MEREMNISCIILNYNDPLTTRGLVEAVRGYEALDSIVIVDNCSTDNSREILKELEGGKIHFIAAEKNGGYGYGNNQGIRYALSELHATHVLVANPDVEFSEACIETMKRAFLKIERLGVAACVAVNPAGEVQPFSWKLHGLLGDLLDTGLVTRRLFGKFLTPHPERDRSRTHVFVDAVPGSLFLADGKAFLECGLYDEEVFLYYEEKILGLKMKEKGYRTVLLTKCHYVHHHSVSISKNITSIRKKQEILHESKLHYYKKYLRISPVEEWTARTVLHIIIAEIRFLTEVLGMSWET